MAGWVEPQKLGSTSRLQAPGSSQSLLIAPYHSRPLIGRQFGALHVDLGLSRQKAETAGGMPCNDMTAERADCCPLPPANHVRAESWALVCLNRTPPWAVSQTSSLCGTLLTSSSGPPFSVHRPSTLLNLVKLHSMPFIVAQFNKTRIIKAKANLSHMSDLICLALNGVVTEMKTKMRTPMELVSQPPIISRGGRTTGKKRRQPSHHQPQMGKVDCLTIRKAFPPLSIPCFPLSTLNISFASHNIHLQATSYRLQVHSLLIYFVLLFPRLSS